MSEALDFLIEQKERSSLLEEFLFFVMGIENH